MRTIFCRSIECFDVSDLPTVRHGLSVHRGVFVCWDEDHDARVVDFLERLDPETRDGLFAVHEHNGALDLVWRVIRIPPAYAEGQSVSVIDQWGNADDWAITESRTVDTGRSSRPEGPERLCISSLTDARSGSRGPGLSGASH